MQADPLAQLKDVHLPAEPSWWPPAPGWWLLLFAVLLLLGVAVRALLRWRARRAPYQHAQALHDALAARLRSGDLQPERYVHEVNALVKRVLLHARSERAATTLTGDAWVAHLATLAPQQTLPASVQHWLSERRFQPSIRALGQSETDEIVSWFDALLKALGRNPSGHAP
ncbi:MAG: DUF4381 domain-containing protein [Pseudomonadota bacterium]